MNLPQIFQGRSVFVCASGPSMNAEDANKLANLPVVAVNSTIELLPRAWVLFASDTVWWRKCEHLWRKFIGLKFCIEQPPANLNQAFCLPSQPGERLRPNMITKGGSGGCCAIQVAYHMGASRIYLLGFDMQITNGQKHWHPDHPMGNPTDHVLPIWAERTDRICADIINAGVPVVNLTRQTSLTVPRGDIDAILDQQQRA